MSLSNVNLLICGPINIKAHNDTSYFLTFINDYSCCGYVDLISYHFEALVCLKCFLTKVENQKERNLKIL